MANSGRPVALSVSARDHRKPGLIIGGNLVGRPPKFPASGRFLQGLDAPGSAPAELHIVVLGVGVIPPRHQKAAFYACIPTDSGRNCPFHGSLVEHLRSAPGCLRFGQ